MHQHSDDPPVEEQVPNVLKSETCVGLVCFNFPHCSSHNFTILDERVERLLMKISRSLNSLNATIIYLWMHD